MAQNEMKAKPALPERVRSMEGLGPIVGDRFMAGLLPKEVSFRIKNEALPPCVQGRSPVVTERNVCTNELSHRPAREPRCIHIRRDTDDLKLCAAIGQEPHDIRQEQALLNVFAD